MREPAKICGNYSERAKSLIRTFVRYTKKTRPGDTRWNSIYDSWRQILTIQWAAGGRRQSTSAPRRWDSTGSYGRAQRWGAWYASTCRSHRIRGSGGSNTATPSGMNILRSATCVSSIGASLRCWYWRMRQIKRVSRLQFVHRKQTRGEYKNRSPFKTFKRKL